MPLFLWYDSSVHQLDRKLERKESQMKTLVKNGYTFSPVAPGVYFVTTPKGKGKASGLVRRKGSYRHVWDAVTVSNRESDRNFRTMTEAASALSIR